MAVYRALAELEGAAPRRRSLALGVFDGVHRGHAKILSSLAASAGRQGLDGAMLLTFHPHPPALRSPQRAPKLILEPTTRTGPTRVVTKVVLFGEPTTGQPMSMRQQFDVSHFTDPSSSQRE